MSFLSKYLLIALSVTALSLPVSNASAQQMPSPVIAVIDVGAVERKSVAWQSLREQIEARRAGFQAQLVEQQNSLEVEQRELQAQQTLLTPEAFQAKQQEFRKKLGELQALGRQRKQELDRLYASARRQIRESLREVVSEIAAERGINLMLNMSREDRTVSFVDNALVVTDEALKRLDERIQSVVLDQ